MDDALKSTDGFADSNSSTVFLVTNKDLTRNTTWRFGSDRAMAGMARQVFIKRYGFTNKCNVGGFTYWRR
jgi:hypothetical protein